MLSISNQYRLVFKVTGYRTVDFGTHGPQTAPSRDGGRLLPRRLVAVVGVSNRPPRERVREKERQETERQETERGDDDEDEVVGG